MRILIKISIIFFVSDWSANNYFFVEGKKPKCFSDKPHDAKFFTSEHYEDIGLVRDTAVEIARILYKKLKLKEDNSLCSQLENITTSTLKWLRWKKMKRNDTRYEELNKEVITKALFMINDFNNRIANDYKIDNAEEQKSFAGNIDSAVTLLTKSKAADAKSEIIVALKNMKKTFCSDYLNKIQAGKQEKKAKQLEHRKNRPQPEAGEGKHKAKKEERIRQIVIAEIQKQIEAEKEKFVDVVKQIKAEVDEKNRLEAEAEGKKPLAEIEEKNRLEAEKNEIGTEPEEKKGQAEIEEKNRLEAEKNEIETEPEGKKRQAEIEEIKQKIEDEEKTLQAEVEQIRLQTEAEKKRRNAEYEEDSQKLQALREQLEADATQRRQERLELMKNSVEGSEERNRQLEADRKACQEDIENGTQKLEDLLKQLNHEADQRKHLFETELKKRIANAEKLNEELGLMRQKLEEKQNQGKEIDVQKS